MSIIINDVNTRKEVDDLKGRVTTLENSGVSGSDKYLQNVELEHLSGGETIKPSNVTIASNNCNYTNLDYTLTLSNPTHEVQRTVEENGSIGVLSTAAAPANGTDAANYWFITQLPSFVPMIGKKIKSMTFKANTTGTVTFAGSTVAAGYTETNGTVIGNLYTQVKDAAQDMFTISATQGTSTYLFDGTDSRVTFLNNLTEFIMPTTLGVKRNVNCGIIHNNTSTNSLAPRTGDDTDVLYGFIQNGSNPISYTAYGYQSFAFDFVYEDTRTVEEDTGLRPVVTFTDEELIVESNGTGGYVIFAEGTDGYGVISGDGNVYWISKTTTDTTQISGLDALAHAPVIALKIQNSSTLDIAYNDTMTTVLLPTVNSAFGNHTMDNFVLGYSRGLSQSDIVDGILEYDFDGTYIENPSDRLIFTMNDRTKIIVDGLNSGGGTTVIANPTLIGGEDALESIQIGSTKYGIESIYPTDVSIEQIPAVTHNVTTTVYGDMSGTLTDTEKYMETPNKITTWWLTQIPEAPIQGKRLKAISLATKAGGTLTIKGSNQTPGYPNESKSDLANKAIANNADAFKICTINTVSGLATYLLDGTDARVTIVSQQYIDSCPKSVGVYEQAGSDSAIIYFPKTQDYADGFVTYWYNGAQAMTRPIGVNFTYEVIDTPAETDLVFELSNGDDISCSLDNVPITTQSASPLKDKRIAFVGDSISMNTMTTYAYYDYLQNMTGCIPIGMGVGGSTITDVVDRSPMCTRVLDVPLVADAVCVLGGTNDFGLSSPLGQQYTVDGNNVRTLNTDTSTFWGALNTMCINLHSRFTTKQIFLMTPIHRGVFKNLSTLTDFTPNSDGHYLEDYVDAIKEACKCFSITCIDLYNTAGLYPHDSTNGTTYYLANTNSGDYLHPNDAGYQRIAKVIKMAMENSIIV